MIPSSRDKLSAKAKTHVVTPTAKGFEVTSGASGRTYLVVPLGGEEASCTCEWARNRAFRTGSLCSHILAVQAFAKSLPAAGCDSASTWAAADAFRRIDDEEKKA